MAIDSGGGGDGSKRQKVDGRCDAVGSESMPVDRISALPDELRLRVLTDLPLKDAIRTGALARGWRDLWKGRWAHRTSAKAHLWSRNDIQRELDALTREPRPRRRLERFSLIVSTSYLKSSEFQRFLDYATECGVEDLHVETRRTSAAAKLKFHLPRSSPALACLSLRNITVPMFYEGSHWQLHALEVIRFVSVSFRPKVFAKMMVRCPSLRSLTIVDCRSIVTSVDFVRVPTLRSFRYSGCASDLPFSIPHDAVLSDLYIKLDDDSVLMKVWNTDKLRRSLPKDLSNLKVLTICYGAFTGASVLSADGARAQWPNFILHSLKELHLLMPEMKAVNLSNLYLFLKTFQCPNVERLFVQFPVYRSTPMESSTDQVWEEPPEDGFNNLVMVKVMGFNWYPTEVQLVSFLLRKAKSLRKLLMVSRNVIVTPVNSLGTPEADISLLKEALVNGKIKLTTSDNAGSQPYHEADI